MTTSTVDLQHVAARLHKATETQDGATLDVDTLDLIPSDLPVFIVGGEANQVGRKIAEVIVKADQWTPGAVFAAVQVLRDRAGGDLTGRLVGVWWVEDAEEFVLDVSGRYDTVEEALIVGRERGEVAIWDNAQGREIFVAA